MYKRKSRLSSRDQSRLIEHFVVGTTARAASEVTGVNIKTATKFFIHLRQLIARKQPSYSLSGEVEADESYFGGVRQDMVAEVLRVRLPYLTFSSKVARYIQRLLPKESY